MCIRDSKDAVVSKEEVIIEPQDVLQIRSLSLPPFNLNGGSSSTSTSGQSTPLVSNRSSPPSSPDDDRSKVEQAAKKQWKCLSPTSVSAKQSSDSSEKFSLKHDWKFTSDVKRVQRSSTKEADNDVFKSPSKRKRKRSRTVSYTHLTLPTIYSV